MHVRMHIIPGIAVRIEIFQLTQIGFSIALHVYVPVHVQNLNLSNNICIDMIVMLCVELKL